MTVKSDTTAVKLTVLSDSERVVVDTITMRLNPREALEYCRDAGFPISESTYFRYKRKIEKSKWERLLYTASRFTEQHLQRMDQLELIEQLMWKEYHEETSPAKRVTILQAIVQMQPYLSRYYDATRFILERRLKTDLITNPRPEIELADKKFNDQEREQIRDTTPFS